VLLRTLDDRINVTELSARVDLALQSGHCVAAFRRLLAQVSNGSTRQACTRLLQVLMTLLPTSTFLESRLLVLTHLFS
jgi:hypothetical protein